MFGSFGLPELLIILVIVIALFGAGRIAGVGRALGQSVRGFREEVRNDEEDDEDEDSEKGEVAASDSSGETVSGDAGSQASTDDKKGESA